VTGVRAQAFTVLASISVLMGCATTQENTASASTSMFGRLRASQERTRWVRSFKPSSYPKSGLEKTWQSSFISAATGAAVARCSNIC
jgi:hypothetical protein